MNSVFEECEPRVLVKPSPGSLTLLLQRPNQKKKTAKILEKITNRGSIGSSVPCSGQKLLEQVVQSGH